MKPSDHDEALSATEPVADSRPPGALPARYAPAGELGRGGMGRVVAAHDKLLGRTVALKEALATDEEALRRFARETQITARLEHPSIVPVYDAGASPDGSPYYVMRKVTGRPLDKLVALTTRLDERLALLPHVLAACQAVAHAHARGVIHRDLKPTNILVGAHGETVVIDWGLAKATGESEPPRSADEPSVPGVPSVDAAVHTRAGMVFGTPGFMPPEQHASSDVDERADVYALGATLYYVLSTKPPPAEGPAPPIAYVVPGVPRELSTIVDKALAGAPADRYRDAGELAADLARFTTGQLVAAHAYSTRERIARFVRRHRALVITIAAAVVVLAIGAWVAIGRVLSARDEALAQARAAELARTHEAERASDLVVSQARLLLATNPTGALAMVRPLAETSRWREVRAVAAGARASGVARRLPGPSSVTCGALSYDGTRALVCGADGTLHVYDLAARTHAVIATLPGRVRAAFADEQRVLAWSGATFTVIDIASKATTTYERPAPIVRVDVQHGTAYFVDDARRAWRLDVATGQVVGIPIPGQVTHVAIAPNAKHVAFGGEHLWLIETKHPELVEQVHAGKKFDLVWAPNGEQLAAVGERSVFKITVHPEIEVGEYGVANQAVTLARGRLYTQGLGGTTIDEHQLGSADLQSSLAGLYPAQGELVVGAGRGVMRVFDGAHEYAVPLPASPVTLLRASPRSPYVLVACGELLLVYDLAHVMPRRIEVPAYAQLVTVGRDRVWTISSAGSARAIDVHTGEARALAKLPPLRFASPASGEFVVARPLANRETWIVRPDGATETIDVGGTYAGVLDGTRAVFATQRHEVVIYDVTTRAKQTIATYGAPIAWLFAREANPRWLVVALDDGTLARHDLASGRAMQLASSADGARIHATAATRTGDVFFATGARLRRWTATGDVQDHGLLPQEIAAVHLLDDDRLLVVTADRTGYVVRTDRPALSRLPALGESYAWSALDPTLIVTDDRTGGVTVLDVVASVSWKIARATPPGMTPDLSGDGTVAVMRDASLDGLAVALWPLDLPTTPAETARWIDDMTNATFDPRTGTLGWPTP